MQTLTVQQAGAPGLEPGTSRLTVKIGRGDPRLSGSTRRKSPQIRARVPKKPTYFFTRDRRLAYDG